MSLWKIAWRSMGQRALASWLTGLSMALGVALVVAVLVIYAVVEDSFRQGAQGYDLIVGAKGGKLQLVLNTVYHLSTPIENIPYSLYKEFAQGAAGEGRFAGYVKTVVPYCLGDSYDEFRVVGTTPAMFDEFRYARGQAYQFAEGRNFKQEEFFEAVIGSLVARKTGLKVGSEFQPTHGVADDGQGHKHDAFTVVGILEPTGTPNDRALFVNMEGFFLLRGHAKEPSQASTREAQSGDTDDHDDADAPQGHTRRVGPAREASAGPPDISASAPLARDQQHDLHEDHDAYEDHEDDELHEDHHAHDEDHDLHDKHDDHDEHDPGHQAHDEHEEGHNSHEHEGAHKGQGGHDHDEPGHQHHEPLPENQREVTALLVLTDPANPVATMTLRRTINKEPMAQAVLPLPEILGLFTTIVGNLRLILLVLAVLIVVVAGIGIMVSIYNSMSDRRREVAVMRSLGARRSTVLDVVLLESILLSLGGGLAGWVLGHGLIGMLSPFITAQTGVSIGWLQFDKYELVLIPGLITLASLVGLLPAISAYRTDVAKVLSSAP